MFDPDGPVLGIDPGVSCCGYGAVRRDRGVLSTVACGVLRTEPSEPLPRRLATLCSDLEQLVAEVRPAAMAVERVLFQANVRTAMSVGQASGLALVVAARAGVTVCLYSPNEVKLAVAGDGGADKAAVQAMVGRLLRLSRPPRPADAADALALALCHLWRDRLGGAIRATSGAAAGTEPAPGPAQKLARRIDAALAAGERGRRATRREEAPA